MLHTYTNDPIIIPPLLLYETVEVFETNALRPYSSHKGHSMYATVSKLLNPLARMKVSPRKRRLVGSFVWPTMTYCSP